MMLDNDRIRWAGSGSAVPARTPFGTYDNDLVFVNDCYRAAQWAGIRLGYPNVDVELVDLNFYAAFEEACNVYNAKINEYNMINNMYNVQGQKISSLTDLTNRAVIGAGIPYMCRLAKDYGTETGTGGTTDWKKQYITCNPRQQEYDLNALLGDKYEKCAAITVRRIFNYRPPAFARIYDPFSMTGMSYSNVLQELGFGAYSPAVQFLSCPIFEDLLRGQAIQFNDLVRKSQYSFEIKNNKLRLFPIPTYSFKLWIEYTNDDEVFANGSMTPLGDKVATDFATVPYQNHTYSDINDPGKMWIRNYFLANCKEILGCIRQKMQTIPISGGEITLDGSELRSEAQQEKQALMESLNTMLEAAGKFAQMSKQSEMAIQLQETLKKIPICIYIG